MFDPFYKFLLHKLRPWLVTAWYLIDDVYEKGHMFMVTFTEEHSFDR